MSTATSKPERTTKTSDDLAPQIALAVEAFLSRVGIEDSTIQRYNSKDFYSHLLTAHIKDASLQRGRVSCLVTVFPAATNYFNGAHGGFIGAVAERVALACARTVVAEDKELFLGELAISYLSSAKQGEVVVAEGSVVRSGRNLTVVSMELKSEKTGKLVYTARATIYHMPASKL